MQVLHNMVYLMNIKISANNFYPFLIPIVFIDSHHTRTKTTLKVVTKLLWLIEVLDWKDDIKLLQYDDPRDKLSLLP